MSDTSQASFILGLISTVAVFVPPGLLVSPIAGLLAIALGVADLSGTPAPGNGHGRAIAGISLGAVGLFVSLALLFLLRRVLWRAIANICAGVGC